MNARGLLGALALAGCASAPVEPLELGGRPLGAAIAAYGYPSEERTVAGRRLVVWRNQVEGYGGGQLACELTYELDAAGRIVGGEVEGQAGACEGLRR